jgi:aconitate decarboxylase
MPYIDRPDPADGLEGKFSWQYTVAVALLDGKVDRSSFSNSRRDAPDMSAMLKRIQVLPDSTMSGHFNSMYVEIRLTLIDGSELLHRCDGPVGSWQRPATSAAIEGKAKELISAAFDSNTCSTIISIIGRPSERLVIGDLMSALKRVPKSQAPSDS